MKMLLHICCGPCTLYPLKVIRADGLDVTGYFFNPNIHPFVEYERRVQSLRSVSVLKRLPIVWEPKGYDLNGWLSALDGNYGYGKRCLACYEIRLERAAQRAKDLGFSVFSTTLLYSKYQFHDEIKEICQEKAKKYGLEFYYHDFRRGWEDGIRESLALGIYRQPYCGCIFSERERYSKREKRLSSRMISWQGGEENESTS